MPPRRTFPRKEILALFAILVAVRLWILLDPRPGFLPSAILAAVLFLYVPALHYWRSGAPRWARMEDPRRTLGAALLLVVAGAAVYSLLLRIPLPPEITPPRVKIPLTPSLAAQLLLLTALPEEVFFRGYLYDAFEEAGWDPILPTAFLFALAHVAIFPWPFRALTFFPGLLFGWGRKVSGNIFVPVTAHLIYNLFPALIGGP